MSISYSNFNLNIEGMSDDEHKTILTEMNNESNSLNYHHTVLENNYDNTLTQYSTINNDNDLYLQNNKEFVPQIEGFTDEIKEQTYKDTAKSLDNTEYTKCVNKNKQLCNKLNSIKEQNDYGLPDLKDIRNNAKLDFQRCDRHVKNCNSMYNDINSYTDNLSKIITTIEELEWKVKKCNRQKNYCDDIDSIINNLEKQFKEQKNSINSLYDLSNKNNCI